MVGPDGTCNDSPAELRVVLNFSQRVVGMGSVGHGTLLPQI